MKRYEKYKDSGVKWIGQIPEHWNTVKTLRCLVMKITDGPHTTPDLFDTGIPFVSAEAVSCGNGSIDFNHIRGYISEEFYEECCKKYIPQKNDVYMIKSGATTGRVSIVDTDRTFTIWSPLAVFRFNPKIASYKYMFYYFQSTQHQQQIKDNWTFGTQQNIGMRTLEQLKICLPPLSEQREIVSYLDNKTKNIELCITLRERELEALSELKKAEIAEVVTRGINPNVPMKDSGIKWIGEIPEHWEVSTIGKNFKQRAMKVSDKDYKPLSVGKMGVVPQLDDAAKTDNGDNRKLVLKGDFVVNSRSDRKGSCGVSAFDGSVSVIYIVLEPLADIDKQYCHYLFRSNSYIEEFYRNGRGIVADLWTTRYQEMKSISIPLPPLAEQREIVSYIEKKTAKIDTMVAGLREQIAQLKELKQRIISDAVTGKCKVAETDGGQFRD